ncbi:putative transcription factor bzip [Erysiphe necator]|uniref:Putative transcription factor bzip n=1 Tax=Uncinula necator TaxID=52586 RepID=A0A0B1P437_UNCNE|nr:putative transcription factor bzip [Erysiphe necator]
MSQKHHAPRSASRSPSYDDDRRITLPPVQPRNVYQGRTDLIECQLSVSDHRIRDPQLHSASNRYFRPKVYGVERDLGVHSILNPDVPAKTQNSARLQNESSELMIINQNPNLKLNACSPRIFSGRQSLISSTSTTDSNSGSLLWMTRPMLTPKSPSRAIHISRATTSGTLDAEESSPFMGSSKQIHTSEPSSTASLESSLNASSSISGQQNPTQRLSKNYPKSNHGGIPGSLNLQSLSNAPLSKIPSPSTSTTSSYNPPTSQNSPVSLIHQGGKASPSNPYYISGSGLGSSKQMTGGMQGSLVNLEGPYCTPDSPQNSSIAGISRQTSASDPIQVLTITTNQGLYTIPVDVHHASRLANEKRARNAGASARFRQRRKEKEKEANLAIEKLQSQVKDLEKNMEKLKTERNFYRSERDRLRDIMLRTPETRYVAMQTPQSPPQIPRSFPDQLETFSGTQQTISGRHDINSEEDESKRRGNIRDSFTDASFVVPSMSQPDLKASTGYSMIDIAQNTQHLYSGVSSSSSQSKLNAILTNSESSDTLRKNFNVS